MRLRCPLQGDLLCEVLRRWRPAFWYLQVHLGLANLRGCRPRPPAVALGPEDVDRGPGAKQHRHRGLPRIHAPGNTLVQLRELVVGRSWRVVRIPVTARLR
ncbi:hypothetical protein ISCGN_030433 [Ixodes scapularis]